MSLKSVWQWLNEGERPENLAEAGAAAIEQLGRDSGIAVMNWLTKGTTDISKSIEEQEGKK